MYVLWVKEMPTLLHTLNKQCLTNNFHSFNITDLQVYFRKTVKEFQHPLDI